MSYLVSCCQFRVEEHHLAFIFVDREAGFVEPGEHLFRRLGEFHGCSRVSGAGRKDVAVVDIECQI